MKSERGLEETDLRYADCEDSVAQLLPNKQPKNLGEGGNCYAWSTISAEEFSHPKTSRKITFSFTHTSAERKCFFEEREKMMPICLIVTLKGALNHSGAVTIKTFFSLAG